MTVISRRNLVERQQYLMANYKFAATQGSLNTFAASQSNIPWKYDEQRDGNQPIFPKLEAFLCSNEVFIFEVEIYDVERNETEQVTGLSKNRIIPVAVRGLRIPSPETKSLTFEDFSILVDESLRGDIDGSGFPIVLDFYTQPFDSTEYPPTKERTVNIVGNNLGLTDLEEFDKCWEKRPHGQLLDVAIFVK